MAFLIKYNIGPSDLVRDCPQLEKMVEKLGQPIVNRTTEGYQLSWLYSHKIGEKEYEQKIATYTLRLDNEREITEFEIIK